MPLDEEDRTFRRTVADFVASDVIPHVLVHEKEEIFPTALIRAMGERGLLRIRYTEGPLRFTLACEELASHWVSLAVGVAMQNLMATELVHRFGSPTIRAEYLEPVLAGSKIAGFAMTEPGAGSDLGALTTTAEKQRDAYLLSGTKNWVALAAEADHLIVLARNGQGTGLDKVNFFVVPSSLEGVRVLGRSNTSAVRALPTYEMRLDGVTIPLDHRLGGEDEGATHLREFMLVPIRVMVASFCLGVAQRALDLAVRRCQEREQFGKPLDRFQAIKSQLAESATQVEAARLLVYRAAAGLGNGTTDTRTAAMAKLFALETALGTADMAQQVHGAYGIDRNYEIERVHRDSRFLVYGGGTPEVLKMTIARNL